MRKLKGEYKILINRFDRRKEQLRRKNEKEIKQFIKTKAINVGLDLTNTQHSLSADKVSYKEELSRKRFQSFQDFIYYMSDEHRIDFYFTIENGKFRWLQ